jgi:hypothetical protein
MYALYPDLADGTKITHEQGGWLAQHYTRTTSQRESKGFLFSRSGSRFMRVIVSDMPVPSMAALLVLVH